LGRKALLLLPLILLAACGGDGGETTVVTEPATSTQTGAEEGPEAPPVLSPDAVRELESFAAGAPGEVAIAVSPLGGGDAVEAGETGPARAWSTMKAPLVVALIESAGGLPGLTGEEQEQADAALTASENEAALTLFDGLAEREGGDAAASAAIEAVLRRAGDEETEVNTEPSPDGFSTFGQTIWRPAASNLFFRALAGGCLLDRQGTDYVLSLMTDVVADQRWGLGESPTPGDAEVAFKGGWGPEPGGGYLVRQSGIVTAGDEGYVISVVAIPSDTSEAAFGAGRELVSEATALVAENAGSGTDAAVTCAQ
jgi:hypothetical protein